MTTWSDVLVADLLNPNGLPAYIRGLIVSMTPAAILIGIFFSVISRVFHR